MPAVPGAPPLPVIPNPAMPSMPALPSNASGPWWAPTISYIAAAIVTSAGFCLIIWWWFSLRIRKPIVDLSVSRQANSPEDFRILAAHGARINPGNHEKVNGEESGGGDEEEGNGERIREKNRNLHDYLPQRTN